MQLWNIAAEPEAVLPTPDIVGRSSLSDNARLAQQVLNCCDIPGRGDGIGRRSGLKHRRRKAWGFDFPPRHQVRLQGGPTRTGKSGAAQGKRNFSFHGGSL